ncbi:MAG: cytochrome ubiquinol oxidase subunit I, partial [Methylosarcina sp.]
MIANEIVELSRLQFALTAMYHFLFVPLTLGLAFLLVIMESVYVMTGRLIYKDMTRFWGKLFGINFAMGVTTGLTLEFQFGTNWAKFSTYAGGIIGQTLAMEGVFAFFLESSFLGILLFGEKRFSRRVQWFAALMLFLGSWLSGYFILATNAWMQHPVAYRVAEDGRLVIESLSGLLTNPWLLWEFAHNMTASVVTASIVMAAVGALYLLSKQHLAHARTCLSTGVVVGAISSLLMIAPTGHESARQVFEFQPIKGAAMEG